MTNGLTNLYESARQTLAASAAFQAWTGSANATEALAYIFLVGKVLPATMPYAVIDRGSLESEDRGFFNNGTILMAFWGDAEGDEDATYDLILAQDIIMVDIIEEMQCLSGQPGYFDMDSIELEVSMRASELQEDKLVDDVDFVRSVLNIKWE